MSYEFIKIVQTDQGDIAYLLDKSRGVVVVAPVEDMRATTPKPRMRYVDEDMDPAPYIPRARGPMRPEDVDQLPDPAPIERPAPPVILPGQRPKSLIPREMRGVFLPQGAPGADVEMRNV